MKGLGLSPMGLSSQTYKRRIRMQERRKEGKKKECLRVFNVVGHGLFDIKVAREDENNVANIAVTV